MKPGKVARRGRRDRPGLAIAGGGVAAILALASLILWMSSPGPGPAATATENRIGGPFNLIDDRGNPVTDRSFPGKYLVVYFGYAACPDICPATLNTLGASLDKLGQKADRVQPLFITIDPAHDTPSVVRRYVRAFSARLIGLSGTAAELNKVADEYRVMRMPHRGAGGATDVGLDHSSVLYLMAPDGSFIAPIPADASEMVMEQAIARNVS